MRIGVLSDLYIDRLGSPPIPEDLPDVLVLAGNIGCGSRGVEWAAKTYTCPIVYVLGSYSYREHNIETFDEELRSTAWGSNLHLLQNETLSIRGVRFVGSTLWTDLARFGGAQDMAEHACTDYMHILNGKGEPITPADTVALHRRAVAYLRRIAAEPYLEGHTVVVTHHAPSLRSVPWQFRDDKAASCFASDLDDLVTDVDALLWVHAGVEGPADYLLGRTHVVANPRGFLSGDGLRGVPEFRPDYSVQV